MNWGLLVLAVAGCSWGRGVQFSNVAVCVCDCWPLDSSGTVWLGGRWSEWWGSDCITIGLEFPVCQCSLYVSGWKSQWLLGPQILLIPIESNCHWCLVPPSEAWWPCSESWSAVPICAVFFKSLVLPVDLETELESWHSDSEPDTIKHLLAQPARFQFFRLRVGTGRTTGNSPACKMLVWVWGLD